MLLCRPSKPYTTGLLSDNRVHLPLVWFRCLPIESTNGLGRDKKAVIKLRATT